MVGSRAQPRSVTESQVPIDAIPYEDVVSQGSTDVGDQLRTLVPLLQRQPAAGGRRGPDHPPRQPARPRPGPHAGAGQRQAPAPGRGHHLDRQRRIRWRAGPGHLRDPVHRVAADRGAAGRRVGPVRLGRHRRGAELPAQGRLERRQPRAAYRRLRCGRRRRLHRGGQRRAAARADRLRQPQHGIRQHRPDQPQRAAGRRGAADRGGQRRRGRPRPDLGIAHHRRQRQALGQLRPPVRRRRAGLRSCQLRQPAGGERFLLPQSEHAGGGVQRRPGAEPADRRRARCTRRHPRRIRRLPGGAGLGRKARPDRPGTGVRGSALLLVPGALPRRLHAAIRRRRPRRVAGRRPARPARRAHRVGRKRERRLQRSGFLHLRHGQRLARAGDADDVRSRPLPAGRDRTQRRSRLSRQRSRAPRRGRRVAGRTLHDRPGRRAVVADRPVRAAGLQRRLERLPRFQSDRGGGLEPGQHGPLRRHRGAGPRRRVVVGRCAAPGGLRGLRHDHERQALRTPAPRRRRRVASQRQQRLPGADPGPAERLQRLDRVRPRADGPGQQRHHPVHITGCRAARR